MDLLCDLWKKISMQIRGLIFLPSKMTKYYTQNIFTLTFEPQIINKSFFRPWAQRKLFCYKKFNVCISDHDC